MAESRGRARGLMILLAFLLLGNMQIADCIFLERQPRVFAIDLGATYSCGVYKKGEVQIIANEQGNRVTPSLVGFTDNETLIGEAAKNQTASNPERTIFDVKRLIGRKFDDEEVQRAMKVVPYKIVNKEGKPYIEVKIKDGETKLSSPEEISAMILHKMKESAEAFLGEKIEEDAVITVPAYFNDAQRQSTKDAGVIAGLNVIGIIDEPTAAVIAYDLNLQRDKLKILVFNLGGHTFDATILKIDNRAIDVLSTIVDSHLGGEDFDQRIMEYLIESIKNKYGKDMSNKADDVAKLRREAELAKRALSTQHQVRVEIESFFNESLSRSRFEELNDDLFKKTLVHVEKAMKDAGLEDKKEIDEIVLAGGSSRIPKVQQLLRDYFDGKELNMGMNPDEVVAYGAAIQGAFLYRQLNPPSYFVNPSKVPRLSQDEIELMVLEAEVWANKDKDDCNRLETYLKKLINDEDGKVEAAAKEGLKWLDRWGFPRKETYEEKLKEVEAVCKRQPNTETMTTTLVTSYTAS